MSKRNRRKMNKGGYFSPDANFENTGLTPGEIQTLNNTEAANPNFTPWKTTAHYVEKKVDEPLERKKPEVTTHVHPASIPYPKPKAPKIAPFGINYDSKFKKLQNALDNLSLKKTHKYDSPYGSSYGSNARYYSLYNWAMDLIPLTYSYSKRRDLKTHVADLITQELYRRSSDYNIKYMVRRLVDEHRSHGSLSPLVISRDATTKRKPRRKKKKTSKKLMKRRVSKKKKTKKKKMKKKVSKKKPTKRISRANRRK